MSGFYIDSNGKCNPNSFCIPSENFFAEDKPAKYHFGNVLRRSAAAGVMIGLACVVYLSCSNRIVGSFLFSFGLMTICSAHHLLFTGRAGFAKNLEDHAWLIFTWFGNVLGIAAIALPMRLCYPEVKAAASEVLDTKMNALIQQLMLGAFLCGFIMFIAVVMYRDKDGIERYLWILMGVPLFLISGYEHSIADMFYVMAGCYDDVTIGAGIFLVCLVSIANYAGARAARWLL